ncbi:hypothetical protein D3C71_1561380 [compost metagenome]
MLVDHHFHLRCAAALQQVDHLLDVKVIGWRNEITARFQEQIHRFMICNIQREIADQQRVHSVRLFPAAAQIIIQRAGIADQHRIGLKPQNIGMIAVLAGHMDARGSQRNLRARRPNGLHGCRELLDELEVGVDEAYAGLQRSLHLREAAAQRGELRSTAQARAARVKRGG